MMEAMNLAANGGCAVGGFVDHHAHLLKESSGVPYPWHGTTVRAFHEQVQRDGGTPMDVPEPAAAPAGELAARLQRGLAGAASAGLVEITEMGMRQWAYLDALAGLGRSGPLPVRVRIYLASGLAEDNSMAELDARRAGCGPWIRLDGVKFYADGWLGPRTCAMCRGFVPRRRHGHLVQDAATLARRIEPWRHTRLADSDACDRRPGRGGRSRRLRAGRGITMTAVSAAMPGSSTAACSAALADRVAALGVGVCIQPSFPVTDAAQCLPRSARTARRPPACRHSRRRGLGC
jgi:predicted amidohydrolase YtcJ